MNITRIAAACLAALALFACKSGDKSESGDKTPETTEQPKAATSGTAKAADRKERDPRVFLRSLGEPEYLDPGLISESEGGIVTHDTFEGLYQYGPTHKEWLPGVAESHEVSPDGRTWTFKLRTNAKWSDGKPVTAHDFEWSWKRVLDPKTASRYAGILWFIEGAEDYNQNPESDDEAKSKALRDAVGVKALDDHTLEVKLVSPTPYFLQLTAFYTYAPVPRHIVEEHGERWARPEHIVSNGPWKVVEWTNNQRIVAEANPHYWDRAKMPFDKIIYLITQENEPAHNMYLGNELDYLESKVPTTVLPKYRRERFADFELTPYLGVYFYMFNVKKKPFDDPRVRQALNLAVDKEKIGKFVVKGGQEAATNIVHPGLAEMGYDIPKGPEFDPDKAKFHLDKSGYAGEILLRTSDNSFPGAPDASALFQQSLSTAGINLDIKREPNDGYWSEVWNAQPFCTSYWSGRPTQDQMLSTAYLSTADWNDTRFKNEQFDQLLIAARGELDPAKRTQMYADANSLIRDDGGLICPMFNNFIDATSDRLAGWEDNVKGFDLMHNYAPIKMWVAG